MTGLKAPQLCRRGVARTFQVVRSFDSMSVIDNVVVGALVRRPGTAAARWKAAEVLEFTGLAGRAGAPAGDLTPPEKRRLEVARALATEPKLLLLDEPLAGTGHEESERVVATLRRLKDRYAIVLVEHDMDAVFALADRITVLVYGRVIATGTPEAVRANAEVRSAYLGEEAA